VGGVTDTVGGVTDTVGGVTDTVSGVTGTVGWSHRHCGVESQTLWGGVTDTVGWSYRYSGWSYRQRVELQTVGGVTNTMGGA